MQAEVLHSKMDPRGQITDRLQDFTLGAIGE
jgi:hypothetical protein